MFHTLAKVEDYICGHWAYGVHKMHRWMRVPNPSKVHGRLFLNHNKSDLSKLSLVTINSIVQICCSKSIFIKLQFCFWSAFMKAYSCSQLYLLDGPMFLFFNCFQLFMYLFRQSSTYFNRFFACTRSEHHICALCSFT